MEHLAVYGVAAGGAMGARCYVVEDMPELASALMEALVEVAGAVAVGHSTDDETAVAWLKDEANGWDIAIVDLNLGRGGRGYNVLSMCSDRQPGQRMVVLTATDDEMVRARCLALGCDRIFDRAFDVPALLDYCAAEYAEASSHIRPSNGQAANNADAAVAAMMDRVNDLLTPGKS